MTKAMLQKGESLEGSLYPKVEQECRWHTTSQSPPDHPGVSRPRRCCRCPRVRVSHTQPSSTQLHPDHSSNEAQSKQNAMDTTQQRSKQNAGFTKRWLKASTTEETYVWVVRCPSAMVLGSQGTPDFTRRATTSTRRVSISTLRPQSTV